MKGAFQKSFLARSCLPLALFSSSLGRESHTLHLPLELHPHLLIYVIHHLADGWEGALTWGEQE